MKIGDKVVINAKEGILSELNGCVGTIVGERIPDGQLAILCGISHWIVKFDEPVVVHSTWISNCEFSENELMLYTP